jgi:signal transduction histidine kinase
LESEGFDVDLCFESAAAVSLFNADVHDVIVCDVGMRGTSGYDLCRRIKTTAGDTPPPVVLVANRGVPIDVYQGLRCEADRFVTRPIEREDFVATLREVLRSTAPGTAVSESDAIRFLGKTLSSATQKDRLLHLLLSAFEDHLRMRQDLDECRAALATATQDTQTLAAELERRIQGSVSEELERREVLFQSQKMEALSDLASGLAHDFNNVLTVVVGNLDTISTELASNPRVAKLGNIALEAALRGGELTRQLLAFSRKQPLAPRVSDLNEIIASMTQMLTPALGEHVKLEVDSDRDLWGTLVDPAQFQVAISNLAKNAAEAMPAGGRVRIETHNVPVDERFASSNIGMTPGEYCLVSVSDTGTGIPAQILPRVFEPLFTTKRGQRGAGLGLSMVFGFVRQSGGHVRIESEEERGTTVRLYLPRAKVEAASATQRSSKTALRAPSGNETVLVVEDDANVRHTVIQQLRQLGYRVLEADRASTALGILDRNDTIDLLFTDMIMPGGMSGRDLGRKASLLRPSLKVLYTSGYMRGLRDDHRLEPSDIFIGKPYRLHELAQKVREALGQRRDRTGCAPCAVADVFRNDQFRFFAFAHELQAFGPARNHLVETEGDRIMTA